MSPGPTFERVYLELKRQLRAGTRPPGTPLEPATIGDELGTSFTPVRDALHRLVGEGMVENPLHNGFAVPRLSEQALRDLYAWNGEVIAMVAVRTAYPMGASPSADGEADAASLFLTMAEATANREHVRIVAQLSDRLGPFRRAEPQLFPNFDQELAELRQAAAAGIRTELSRCLSRYHKRRNGAVPQLLAILQRGL